jgi:hypothetical protein
MLRLHCLPPLLDPFDLAYAGGIANHVICLNDTTNSVSPWYRSVVTLYSKSSQATTFVCDNTALCTRTRHVAARAEQRLGSEFWAEQNAYVELHIPYFQGRSNAHVADVASNGNAQMIRPPFS